MKRGIVFLAILALLARSAVTEPADEVVPMGPSCETVTADVAPCLSFIHSNNDLPSEACCNGVKELYNEAKTQADRQSVCECLKELLASVGNHDKNRIPLIPQDCGIHIILPSIDANTDCSQVKFASYVD